MISAVDGYCGVKIFPYRFEGFFQISERLDLLKGCLSELHELEGVLFDSQVIFDEKLLKCLDRADVDSGQSRVGPGAQPHQLLKVEILADVISVEVSQELLFDVG